MVVAKAKKNVAKKKKPAKKPGFSVQLTANYYHTLRFILTPEGIDMGWTPETLLDGIQWRNGAKELEPETLSDMSYEILNGGCEPYRCIWEITDGETVIARVYEDDDIPVLDNEGLEMR